METFFGPWAEISVLKEDVMGPEHEQARRFKVSASFLAIQLLESAFLFFGLLVRPKISATS